jgi:hypothetical protein
LPASAAANGGVAPAREFSIPLGGSDRSDRGVAQSSAASPPAANAPNPRPSIQPAPSGLVALAGNTLALSGFWEQVPSWLVSTAFHLGFILVLATYSVVGASRSEPGALATVTRGDGDGDGDVSGLDEGSLDPVVESPPADNKLDQVLQPTTTAPLNSDPLASSAALLPTAPDIASPLNTMLVPAGTGGSGEAPSGDGELLGGIANGIAGSLQGRLSAANRARLVGSGGGTLASEDAVGLALKWLSEHQNYDGSWSFDHNASGQCRGRCGNPGRQVQAQIASTALGLLPFLGAGETHLHGRYKANVKKALDFLGQAMYRLGGTGSLWEPGGRFYGHGLAAIALCEAYGMTRDNGLKQPAQKSIDFIVHYQDPVGGGWRYFPQRPDGDTSVVGWQMMALKSANMAYLEVPAETIRKAGYFLDSVQQEEGATYGYISPGDGAATSAIGLLCRMYMGWPHDRPALVRGVTILSQNGPSLDNTGPPRNDMYYNYYGTQVLHHYGGYEWTKWNAAMRDYLVATQGTKGHEAGSWYFDGTDHGSAAGGRLYCTAMSTMILEVYYRHLPLYSEQSTKDKFK